MTNIASIDMHARTSTEANALIVREAATYLSEQGHESSARTLLRELTEILDEPDSPDFEQWLHELALDAEELLNEIPNVLAGSEDGQHWQIVELPENVVVLYDNSFHGPITIHTDMDVYAVHEEIASNVGVWWDPRDSFEYADTDGVILLSDSWEARYNDDIILDSGIRSL